MTQLNTTIHLFYILSSFIKNSTYFMFSFHQSFTDESDAFSSKIATPQLQLFDLMQTFD